MANCIPEPDLRRLLVGLDVEGKSIRLAAWGHPVVHLGHRRLLCRHRPARGIRPESQIVGEGHTWGGSCDGGLNMQITEVRVRPANKELVKAYASICLDDCFLVHEIKVINGPRGLFISFPTLKLSDGSRMDIAFAVNYETRSMIEQAILAEYEKVAADPLPSATLKDNCDER